MGVPGLRPCVCPLVASPLAVDEGMTMRPADYLALWLVANYVVIGGAYAWSGDYWRVLYWVAAGLITVATVGMR